MSEETETETGAKIYAKCDCWVGGKFYPRGQEIKGTDPQRAAALHTKNASLKKPAAAKKAAKKT